ncbi:MAG: hypothetical protein WCI27_00730 [Candidatus Omnitrophota bacterium]
MKNALVVFIFLVAAVSFFLLIRFGRENTDITKILEQERYSRMSAEEELQRGEYRVKKLEADLQSTQIRLARLQESMDKIKEENILLKADIKKAERLGHSQENALRKELQVTVLEKAALESRLGKMAEELHRAKPDSTQESLPVEVAR